MWGNVKQWTILSGPASKKHMAMKESLKNLLGEQA